MEQTSFIMSLNRPEKVYRWKDLPKHIQEHIKALHANGFLVEVFGEITRDWSGPISTTNALWEPKKYYRLFGAAHCATRTRKNYHDREYYFLHDATALPEGYIGFTAEGCGLCAAMQKYP